MEIVQWKCYESSMHFSDGKGRSTNNYSISQMQTICPICFPETVVTH